MCKFSHTLCQIGMKGNALAQWQTQKCFCELSWSLMQLLKCTLPCRCIDLKHGGYTKATPDQTYRKNCLRWSPGLDTVLKHELQKYY